MSKENMKKLNNVIYNKLILQAKEAEEQGLTKLAFGVLNSIGSVPEDENHNYNYDQLQDDIYNGLWKLANCVIKYHDLNSADVIRINQTLESLAEKVIEEVEHSLNIDYSTVGPNEDKVPGQDD